MSAFAIQRLYEGGLFIGLDRLRAVVGAHPGHCGSSWMAAQYGKAGQSGSCAPVAAEAADLDLFAGASSVQHLTQGGNQVDVIVGHAEVGPVEVPVRPRGLPPAVEVEPEVRGPLSRVGVVGVERHGDDLGGIRQHDRSAVAMDLALLVMMRGIEALRCLRALRPEDEAAGADDHQADLGHGDTVGMADIAVVSIPTRSCWCLALRVARIRGASSWATCNGAHVSSDRPAYDEIGRSYSMTRREDPRIAREIHACLGDGASVVNVGAGTGSYEPDDRFVVAVEPSPEMLGQRRSRSRRVVRGVAEALPFPDAAFDAAMAVLTIHHWVDPYLGLRELRRVSTRQVVFYFEPLHTRDFWALEYFPEALQLPVEHSAPGEEVLRAALRVREIRPVLVPHDCVDRRNGHLRQLTHYDGGYRIAIAE